MIDLVNEGFVPLWLDIRRKPLPDLRALEAALEGITLDDERRVSGAFSTSFFLRSVVLSPDGDRLLNPQGKPSLGQLFGRGHFAYAQVKAEDYLAMLEGCLSAPAPGAGPPDRP